jgi:predicted aldo/keto reductase-like oxidoreductase
MQYRTLGQTGVRVSALGFGAMRLPTCGSESAVDAPRAIEMIRYAIDRGVNYLDTAYVYHGGNGESAVGQALAEGYRDRVYLATKLPVWSVTSQADCERLLNEQLARLGTDHVDFYLLHCVQQKSWLRMRELGVLDWARRAQRGGRFRHFGFSFHDDYATFAEIVDGFDWEFCQIQYNYVCEDVQAGTRGLVYAAQRGLGVIVMEPLFGGTLANPPPTVRAIWDAACPPGNPVELALQWLWHKPEVSFVLSGMSTLDQVRQNIDSACRSRVGGLTTEQEGLLARVRDEYQRLAPIPCTKCGYCLPCPSGVDIPLNFELFNQATVLQGSSAQLCRNLYLSLPEAVRATACEECGRCEERCPQHLAVRELLPQIGRHLGSQPSA